MGRMGQANKQTKKGIRKRRKKGKLDVAYMASIPIRFPIWVGNCPVNLLSFSSLKKSNSGSSRNKIVRFQRCKVLNAYKRIRSVRYPISVGTVPESVLAPNTLGKEKGFFVG